MTTTAPPDADLACPLCGYNLRGLVDPRCPECGFAFTWDELRDRDRDHHPWLFEHARRRRRRAFVGTYIRTCLPRQFWRAVKPTNTVHVGRLVAYWAIAGGLLALVALVPVIQHVRVLILANAALRSAYVPSVTQPGEYDGPPLDEHPANIPLRWSGPFYSVAGNSYSYAATHTSITADQLSSAAPPPLSAAFLLESWRSSADLPQLFGRDGNAPAAFVVMWTWPWVSLVTLLLFRASMRQAKVSPAHVLRVVVYGCDFGLLLVAVMAVLYSFTINKAPLVTAIPLGPFRAGARPVLLVLAMCVAVSTYRLSIAYGRYLRFHRPWLTVAASQLVAALGVFLLLVWTTGLFDNGGW
jgi:hypothetical protein